jgi:hypothetical protein
MQSYIAGERDGAGGEIGKDVDGFERRPVDHLQPDELVSSHHHRHPLRIEEQAGRRQLRVVAVPEHVAQLLDAQPLPGLGVVLGGEDGDVLAVGPVLNV